jgi:hypothetical protein
VVVLEEEEENNHHTTETNNHHFRTTRKHTQQNDPMAYHGQGKAMDECLSHYAASYDWALVIDADEFFWWHGNGNLIDFIHTYASPYRYISLGKYMYTMIHQYTPLSTTKNSTTHNNNNNTTTTTTVSKHFGVEEFPFTPGVYCLHGNGGNGRGLHPSYCPTWVGRCKLLVRPKYYSHLDSVHGQGITLANKETTIHFPPSIAHFKEWVHLHVPGLRSKVTTHTHRQSFLVEKDEELATYFPMYAHTLTNDGKINVTFDTTVHPWMSFVAQGCPPGGNVPIPQNTNTTAVAAAAAAASFTETGMFLQPEGRLHRGSRHSTDENKPVLYIASRRHQRQQLMASHTQTTSTSTVTTPAPANPTSPIRMVSTATNVFMWKCGHSCDCLPPVHTSSSVSSSTTVYFHSSYKTLDQTKWPPGWTYFWHQWLYLHPNNTHILWTDETNTLLAECIGPQVAEKYAQMGTHNGPIDKVDYSRALYMYYYGGLYHDMDVFPLRPQQELYNSAEYRNATVLLQGRHPQANAKLALEYAFTRQPQHTFWKDYVKRGETYDPLGLSAFYESYSLSHSRGGSDSVDLQVVPWQHVTPIEWDFKGISDDHVCNNQLVRKPDKHWDNFTQSPCHEALLQAGAYVFSSYTASWTNWGQKGGN